MKYAPGQTCSVDGCSGRPIGRGFCSKHYRLYMKYGDTEKRRTPPHKCKLPYCNRGVEGHGYCLYHNHLIRMSGMKGEFEDIFGGPPYICHVCGKQYLTWEAKDLQADHVISRKHGGKNHINNLKPACVQCNRIKREMSLNELIDFCNKVSSYHSLSDQL